MSASASASSGRGGVRRSRGRTRRGRGVSSSARGHVERASRRTGVTKSCFPFVLGKDTEDGMKKGRPRMTLSTRIRSDRSLAGHVLRSFDRTPAGHPCDPCDPWSSRNRFAPGRSRKRSSTRSIGTTGRRRKTCMNETGVRVTLSTKTALTPDSPLRCDAALHCRIDICGRMWCSVR